jgi:hypothetical protein
MPPLGFPASAAVKQFKQRKGLFWLMVSVHGGLAPLFLGLWQKGMVGAKLVTSWAIVSARWAARGMRQGQNCHDLKMIYY